jgi:hypothetical protein
MEEEYHDGRTDHAGYRPLPSLARILKLHWEALELLRPGMDVI